MLHTHIFASPSALNFPAKQRVTQNAKDGISDKWHKFQTKRNMKPNIGTKFLISLIKSSAIKLAAK